MPFASVAPLRPCPWAIATGYSPRDRYAGSRYTLCSIKPPSTSRRDTSAQSSCGTGSTSSRSLSGRVVGKSVRRWRYCWPPATRRYRNALRLPSAPQTSDTPIVTLLTRTTRLSTQTGHEMPPSTLYASRDEYAQSGAWSRGARSSETGCFPRESAPTVSATQPSPMGMTEGVGWVWDE